MDTQNSFQPKAPKPNEQGSKRTMLIVVIIALLLVNALLLWQFFDKKQSLDETQITLDESLSEKDALQKELDSAKGEFDRINQENAGMQAKLSEKDAEIQAKVEEIQRLIKSGDAAQLKKAKNELGKLKLLNRIYLIQIDSLHTVNTVLKGENQQLTTTLTNEKSKTQNLSQENVVLANKVAIGSILKTSSVTANGVKFKSSGKESETNRTNAIEKIKVCFVIEENLVVDKSRKDIFVRIKGPDGSILSNGNETFMYKGQPTLYSTKETINYDNTRADLCLYWAKNGDYPKGDYEVEIFADGAVIGKSFFSLK